MSQCCPDSHLSTTGNVIGIFTFALGVFAYCITYVVVTHGATSEMEDFSTNLRIAKDQILKLLEHFSNLQLQADPDVVDDTTIKSALNALIEPLRDLCNQVESIKDQSSSSSLHIWRHLYWVYKRGEIVGKMAMIVNHQALLSVSLFIFLVK